MAGSKRRRTNAMRDLIRRRFGGKKSRNNNKVDFTGIRSQGPINPRTAQDAPWNPIVVQRSVSVADATSFSISLAYVRDVLANQLGLTSDNTLTFRILAMNTYDMAGRPIEMAIYNFTSIPGAYNSQLITSVSWPGRVSWPRVKYVWPRAISAIPLSFAGPNTTAVAQGAVATPLGVVDNSSTVIMLRFHLLWRPTQLQTVPSHTLAASNDTKSFTSPTMNSLCRPDYAVKLPTEEESQLSQLGIHMEGITV